MDWADNGISLIFFNVAPKTFKRIILKKDIFTIRHYNDLKP